MPAGEEEQEGVPVVEGTPNVEALLQIMLKRVWGVQVDKETDLVATLLLVSGLFTKKERSKLGADMDGAEGHLVLGHRLVASYRAP